MLNTHNRLSLSIYLPDSNFLIGRLRLQVVELPLAGGSCHLWGGDHFPDLASHWFSSEVLSSTSDNLMTLVFYGKIIGAQWISLFPVITWNGFQLDVIATLATLQMCLNVLKPCFVVWLNFLEVNILWVLQFYWPWYSIILSFKNRTLWRLDRQNNGNSKLVPFSTSTVVLHIVQIFPIDIEDAFFATFVVGNMI